MPAELPPMGRPPVTTSRLNYGRVFACHLASSCRL
jgi:hypothetical protein